MSEALRKPVDAVGKADVLARLAAHRTLKNAPRAELEWPAEHGTLENWDVGFFPARKGHRVDGLYVIFKGRVSHMTDQGGTWRKVMDWRDGDVTGQLPYSRMVT